MTKKVPVILGNDHLRAIGIIQHRIGEHTAAAAIRYALIEQARIIEREQAQKVSLPPVRPPCKSQVI